MSMENLSSDEIWADFETAHRFHEGYSTYWKEKCDEVDEKVRKAESLYRAAIAADLNSSTIATFAMELEYARNNQIQIHQSRREAQRDNK